MNLNPKPEKEIKYSKEDENFLVRIDKIVPRNEDKCLLILTLLGASASTIEFITNEHNIKNIPIEIRYACAVLAGNIKSFMKNQPIEFINFPHEKEYIMSEQKEERIYRKMKYIVEMMYKNLEEEENENKRFTK